MAINSFSKYTFIIIFRQVSNFSNISFVYFKIFCATYTHMNVHTRSSAFVDIFKSEHEYNVIT